MQHRTATTPTRTTNMLLCRMSTQTHQSVLSPSQASSRVLLDRQRRERLGTRSTHLTRQVAAPVVVPGAHATATRCYACRSKRSSRSGGRGKELGRTLAAAPQKNICGDFTRMRRNFHRGKKLKLPFLCRFDVRHPVSSRPKISDIPKTARRQDDCLHSCGRS